MTIRALAVPLVLAIVLFAVYQLGREQGATPRVVVIDPARRTMALVDTDAGAQTVSRLDGEPTGLYYDFAELIPAFRPDAKRILMLGVGGGEMFKVLRRAKYTGQLDGVDKAADTNETARLFDDGSMSPRHIYVFDALDFASSCPSSYEGIIVDLYDGANMSPEQLSAELYKRLVSRCLAPRGVVLVNVAHRADANPVAEAMHAGGLHDVYAMRAPGDNTILLGMVKDDWGGVKIPMALSDSVDHRWTP